MMQREIAATRLADLSVDTQPLVLDSAQLADLAALPNVASVQPRSFYATRAYVGARRVKAYVIGIPDYTAQHVDLVHLASGRLPAAGSALTEAQNARQGVYDGRAGDTLKCSRWTDRRSRCRSAARVAT